MSWKLSRSRKLKEKSSKKKRFNLKRGSILMIFLDKSKTLAMIPMKFKGTFLPY
jgi:hypothetical protein